MSFRELSKLLAIALKSSRSNPHHIETYFGPFLDKIFNIYSCTQSCNGNKLTPMWFLLNSPSHTKAVVLLSLVCCLVCFPLVVGVLSLSLFWCVLICVISSFAIILKRKRELLAFLLLS